MNRWSIIRVVAALSLLFLISCVTNKEDRYIRFPPNNPVPIDGTTNVSLTPTLYWGCTHPDGYPLYFEVYIGAEEEPMILVSDHQTENFMAITDSLSPNTVYYWRIVAWDDAGRYDTNPVWKFTTTSVGG